MSDTAPPGRRAADATPAGRFCDVLLLFDWNGTLVLDTDRARDATNVVLRARGLPSLSRDEFAGRFLLPMAAMFRTLGIGPSDVDGAEAEWNAAAAEVPALPRAGLADPRPARPTEARTAADSP
jgi:phosphoglycolate phosphatase